MYYEWGIGEVNRTRLIPLSAIFIQFDDDTYRILLIEQDSQLTVQGVGEPNDLGSEDMTAVVMRGTAVIMHNAYEDDFLRVLMRRLARDRDKIVTVKFEAAALEGQEGGSSMLVNVEDGMSTVRDISVPPWSVEWIPTERPRWSITFNIALSIDVLDDDVDGEDKWSRIFHQHPDF